MVSANKIEVWEPDDLRNIAWRVSAIADSIGGKEQTDLEEAVAALFSAAEQLESL